MGVKEDGLMSLLTMLLPRDLLPKINIHIEERTKNAPMPMVLIRLLNIKDLKEDQALKLL